MTSRDFTNVIHVILVAFMEHIVEDNGHGTLVSGACILEAKGHDRVVEVAYGCSEAVFSAS